MKQKGLPHQLMLDAEKGSNSQVSLEPVSGACKHKSLLSEYYISHMVFKDSIVQAFLC